MGGFGVTHNHLPTLKRLVGTVISTGMDRTAVVAVQRLQMHPRTRKFLRVTTKYFCHDHHEVCGMGDRVEINKCAPVSKKKYFTVIDMIHRHPQVDGEPFPLSALRRPPSAHGAADTGAPRASPQLPAQAAAEQQQRMQ
jgi:small subunit ribosomal protein S17